MDRARLRELCANAEVVYNCTHVPYEQQLEVLPRQEALLETARVTGAKLVVLTALTSYGPTGGRVMTEDLPFAATSRKGRLRAELDTRYLRTHQTGEIRVVLGNSADFFGPRVLNSSLGAGVFLGALRGAPVLALGDIDLPHSYTYIHDVARGLATLGDRDEASGRMWHLPTAPALSTRQVHATIAELLGRPLHVEVLSEPKPWGPFDESFMEEYAELFYWHTEPFVMDSSAIQRAFGLRATPIREALRETVQWYEGRFAGGP